MLQYVNHASSLAHYRVFTGGVHQSSGRPKGGRSNRTEQCDIPSTIEQLLKCGSARYLALCALSVLNGGLETLPHPLGGQSPLREKLVKVILALSCPFSALFNP